LYTAEKAFFVEYNAYHTAFQAVGFAPEGKLRYNVGFSGAGTNAAAAQGYVAPATVDLTKFSAVLYCGVDGAFGAANTTQALCTTVRGANGAAPPAIPGTPGGSPATVTAIGASPTFYAAAAARISTNSTNDDVWVIDYRKELLNRINGID
jgi:type IV pilus assembly protein PilA